MGDREIEQVLKHDFSAGTDEFREALLQQCLTVLGDEDGIPLEDADLDMLAAAGDITAGLYKPLEY